VEEILAEDLWEDSDALTEDFATDLVLNRDSDGEDRTTAEINDDRADDALAEDA